jgi:hypothetical protein
MFVNRTRGVVWAAVGALSLVACSDPSQVTDLRPEGPPEVLSVLVMNDAVSGLYEGATFCKAGDNKRPNLVGTPDGNLLQICPADQSMGADEVTDANPQNWYVRIMFDELLDPNIEELVPITDDTGMDTGTYSGTIANTKPVKLQCESVNGGMVDIDYDGYYSPAGNNVTWPLGPSLVIKANHPELVATQSECQVTINTNVTDKDGNQVPSDQLGPYKFKIAPVSIIAADTSPSDGDMIDPLGAGVDVTFNTAIDPTTLAFTFTPDPGGEANWSGAESDTEFFLGGYFALNTMYTWAIPQGTKIKDQCGKETTFGAPSVDDGTQVGFTTNDLEFTGIAPFDGQMNAKPKDKIQVEFNQFMDPTTLANSEWSLSPAVTGAGASFNDSGTLIVDAELAPSTDYTFTLNTGATIDDCPGLASAFGDTCMTSGTFTNSADQVVHFKTAALALSSTSPADNDAVEEGTVTIDLVFNFDADATSLLPAEFTSSSGVTFSVDTTASGGNVIELASDAAVTPGDYTFTLKAGATIDDMEATPSTYTQAADQVIHFTVEAAPPTPTAQACY